MAQTKKEAVEACLLAVAKTQRSFRQFIQSRLKESSLDLTYEMLQVLQALWQQDGSSQQQLADTTLKDKASMTYLIQNLENRSLVIREEDAGDRRNKLVFLTKEGKKLQQKAEPWLEEAYALVGKSNTVSKLDEMTKTLEQMQQHLTGAMVPDTK